MTRSLPLVVALLLATLPTLASAQSREQLLKDFARDKANVLAYTKAIPDSAMGFRPTPGVRTLAEQIIHVVESNVDVAAEALKGVKAPELGDMKAMGTNKAALVKYVGDAYDYTIKAIGDASPAALAKQVSVYKLKPQSATEWLVLAHEHSVWTLGQTVPYLRLNGVKPPDYSIPF